MSSDPLRNIIILVDYAKSEVDGVISNVNLLISIINSTKPLKFDKIAGKVKIEGDLGEVGMAVKAYVLINIEPGRTEQVVDSVRSVENVKFSFLVAGRYDMIASIEAQNMKDISEVVCSKIRSIQGVSKTETLLVT